MQCMHVANMLFLYIIQLHVNAVPGDKEGEQVISDHVTCSFNITKIFEIKMKLAEFQFRLDDLKGRMRTFFEKYLITSLLHLNIA